jgi:predicted DNA-binding protein
MEQETEQVSRIFSLTEFHDRLLRLLAQKTGKSMSRLVREGIEALADFCSCK